MFKGGQSFADIRHKIGRFGKGWANSKTIARTNLEDTVAYFWDFFSRENVHYSGNLERKVLKGEGWTQLVRKRQKVDSKHGRSHSNRITTSNMQLLLLDEDTIIILQTPEQHLSTVERRLNNGAVSIETSAIRFTRLGTQETRIEIVVTAEVELGTSSASTRDIILNTTMQGAAATTYFLDDLKDNITKQDGKTLGSSIMIFLKNHGDKSKEARIEADHFSLPALSWTYKKIPVR